jgi:hypothetical protein
MHDFRSEKGIRSGIIDQACVPLDMLQLIKHLGIPLSYEEREEWNHWWDAASGKMGKHGLQHGMSSRPPSPKMTRYVHGYNEKRLEIMTDYDFENRPIVWVLESPIIAPRSIRRLSKGDFTFSDGPIDLNSPVNPEAGFNGYNLPTFYS